MVVSTAKKPKPRTHMTPADLAHEGALALVEEQFRDFDVVWAKVGSFPWWPAVVFHSWDVVRDVGLPTEEKKLPIPEPRRVPVLDIGGAETGDFRLVSHCLVMFVDQFNFSVVEIEPKSIVSYVGYYNKNRDAVVNAKPGSKVAKYKKRFNEALSKADGLLHMVRSLRDESVDAWPTSSWTQPIAAYGRLRTSQKTGHCWSCPRSRSQSRSGERTRRRSCRRLLPWRTSRSTTPGTTARWMKMNRKRPMMTTTTTTRTSCLLGREAAEGKRRATRKRPRRRQERETAALQRPRRRLVVVAGR